MAKSLIGLFCFDGPLYKDINGVYCNITLTNEMFNRYFDVVDELIIVVRTFQKNKTYRELNMKPLYLERIKVIEVDNYSRVIKYFHKRAFIKSVCSVLKKVDLIFARMPSVTSNLVLSAVRKMKKNYLVEVGGCAWDSYWNHGFLGKIVAPIMYFKEKKYVKKAHYCTYVTKYFLQKRYPNNYKSINCSNVYLHPVSEQVLQKRLDKIRQTNFRTLVFGQAVNSIDVKYKGEDIVIKLLPWLKTMGFNVVFEIVGPGEADYLSNVAKKYGVESQVIFKGTLNKEEICNWYQQIDLYIQPSKQEGLPRSVIEAMGMGCPCVGSRIAGIPELLEDKYTFNPRKVLDLKKTLLSILNSDAFASMANANYQNAKNYYVDDLNSKRKSFFIDYKNSILNKKEEI